MANQKKEKYFEEPMRIQSKTKRGQLWLVYVFHRFDWFRGWCRVFFFNQFQREIRQTNANPRYYQPSSENYTNVASMELLHVWWSNKIVQIFGNTSSCLRHFRTYFAFCKGETHVIKLFKLQFKSVLFLRDSQVRCCWFLEKKLGFSLVGLKSKGLNREINCRNIFQCYTLQV